MEEKKRKLTDKQKKIIGNCIYFGIGIIGYGIVGYCGFCIANKQISDEFVQLSIEDPEFKEAFLRAAEKHFSKKIGS